MANRIVLGVQITRRMHQASEVQGILTKYGCNIRTRLGLHEVTDTTCSTVGLLLLDTYGDERLVLEMATKLAAIEGVVVQKMVFEA